MSFVTTGNPSEITEPPAEAIRTATSNLPVGSGLLSRQALRLFYDCKDSECLSEGVTDADIAAIIYTAARKEGEPVTIGMLVEKLGIEEKAIRRGYKFLCNELNITPVTQHAYQFLDQAAHSLELPERVEETASEIIQLSDTEPQFSGCNPQIVSTAAIYTGAVIETYRISLAQLGDEFGVGKEATRRVHKELLRLYCSGREETPDDFTTPIPAGSPEVKQYLESLVYSGEDISEIIEASISLLDREGEYIDEMRDDAASKETTAGAILYYVSWNREDVDALSQQQCTELVDRNRSTVANCSSRMQKILKGR